MEYFVKQYKKLGVFSRKRFFNEQDREDFRAYAIIKIIEGRKATFRQLFTDYLREFKGDARSRNFESQRSVRVPECYDRGTSEREAALGVQKSRDNLRGTFGPDDRTVRRYIADMQGNDGVIANMYFAERYNEKEIADIYGLTESRICQILGRIKNILKKEIESEIIESRFSTEKNFGVFDLDWITL